VADPPSRGPAARCWKTSSSGFNDAYGIANADSLEAGHLQAVAVGRSTRDQIAAAGNQLIGWYEAWTAEPNEQAQAA
jgi:hypothetical protein